MAKRSPRALSTAKRLITGRSATTSLDVGMSEYTFKRGLRELLDKRFISPKDGVSFWTNPALFFKGDRVMFIKEYRRRKANAAAELETDGQKSLSV
jgi:hypothetical protein